MNAHDGKMHIYKYENILCEKCIEKKNSYKTLTNKLSSFILKIHIQ